MASPGQKRGLCAHLMAGFNSHAHCPHGRDKDQGNDPCVKNNDCKFCNSLSQDQKVPFATPYQEKKKHDHKSHYGGVE